MSGGANCVCWAILQIDDCDACATKLHVFVGEVRDVGDCGEVLADELAQNAVSLSVKDAHARHSHKDGVVDEIGDGIEGFVASHPSHVEVLMEVLPVGVDGLARLAADVVSGEAGVFLCWLAVIGQFQTLQAHLRAHTAKDDSCRFPLDAFYRSHGLQALDADGGADGDGWLLGAG